MNVMLETHIAGEALTPLLPSRLPSQYVRLLDPENKYLTQKELSWMTDYLSDGLPVDDRMVGFLDTTYLLFNHRLDRTQETLDAIEYLDFFEPDSLQINPEEDSIFVLPDEQFLVSWWRRHLKFKVLSRYHKDTPLATFSRKEVNDYLNVRLKEVISDESCRMQSLRQSGESFRSFVFNNFLGALAQCYDPHSQFLSTEGQELFLSGLSSEMFSSGLIFDYSDGRIVIDEIIPLSTASRTPNLQVGDEILSMRMDGTLVPVSCIPDEALYEYFYTGKTSELELEVRSSADQQVRNFRLEKTTTVNSGNHSLAYILSTPTTRIGYIRFPGFYSDFGQKGRSSGQDLAMLLLLVNKEKPDGLIIDLRNNGGGSIDEAIDLCSFFVDYGPLFLAQESQVPEPIIYKDTRKGKLYSGKVIFLVNTFSASASEILVSALRNYPDVLIVGSTTFGKSTGQTLFPLILPDEDEPFGLASITTMRIYGIDGVSYQGTGVKPDIELPYPIPKDFADETAMYFYLKNPPITKTVAPPRNRNALVEKLNIKYLGRLPDNQQLQRIISMRDTLSALAAKPVYESLVFGEFKTTIQDIVSSMDFYDEKYFTAKSLEDDESFLEAGTTYGNECEHDPVLIETFRILEDWIDLTK